MILIADEMHPSLMKGLEANHISFNYQPGIKLLEAREIIAQYEGLVVRSKFAIDSSFIDMSPRLEFIARAGSGTDNIDIDYAAERAITIINAPEGLSDAVAEHAIGLILALQHKIVQGNTEVKNLKWQREENRGFELRNSTVGIIGYGNTGSALAKKLSGFDVKVLAYDKYRKWVAGDDNNFFFDAYATSCSLNTIYELSDILTLHIPLTKETEAWVNKKFFEQFKKPIVFINTSRGKIVNTFDLTMALESGKIKAAGLDVLEQEPPFTAGEPRSWFNTLREMNQVIITPHIAGWSTESYKRISEILAKKIIGFYSSKSK